MRFLICMLFLLPTLSAAQGLGREQGISTSCVRLPGLVHVLDQVVNEQQIYLYSSDVYRGQGDCAWVTGRQFNARFIGWIITDRWLVPLERIQYLDRAQERAWRPGDILSRKRFTLRKRCLAITQSLGGVRVYGHQLDARRPWCASAILISN